MTIICLIPARGGSKRLPGKNMKYIKDVPLVAHAIQKAVTCPYITEVYVSTDDEDIANIAKAYKAKVIMRPEKESSDKATAEDVIAHFSDNIDYDYLVYFECTYPLTTMKDLSKVILSFLTKGEYDSVLSLKRTKDYVWTDKNGLVFPPYKLGNVPRTQDFEGILIESGGIYITSKEEFLKTRSRVSGKIGYVELDHPSIEIDTEHDFKMAEVLMNDE